MTSTWISLVLAVGMTGAILTGANSLQVSPAHQLARTLLSDYREAGVKLARPVTNITDTMDLQFGLALIQIDIDTTTNTLTAGVWLRYSWQDSFLQWDPAMHSGLTKVHLPITDIWTPDIVLFNGLGKMDINTGPPCIVYNDGRVMWLPPALVELQCSHYDRTYWCGLKFGTWTYNGWEIDLSFFDKREAIDLSDYFQSNIFEVVRANATKNVLRYPCCEEPYQDLTFHLELRGGAQSTFPLYSLTLVSLMILTQ